MVRQRHDLMDVNLSKLQDAGGQRSLCATVHGGTESDMTQ